ncbi:translation initiation factor 3 bIF-3 [Nitzschia inconspicua]|uniref:Translation initiation factor 3 bIF-3 n=2 Tax=Nitzschia inconspicua TaxID=303405 RepID=A0A9K3LSW4_9STRA|nr:translation initiation factor 3 bIF-3 [Nitzschia inconspicua]
MIQLVWAVALLWQSLETSTTTVEGFSALSFGRSSIAPQSASVRRDSPFFSATSLFMARQANSRAPPVMEQRPPMNNEITASELRVVAPNKLGKDEPLGIMSRAEALAKAQEMGGLDLILVNANSDPPVCKIVDYSKYRYMLEKKAKEVKKNSKATEIKEVKMSYKIDVHDYEVRKKNAIKFLKQGNRVKCSVMFRGREVQHDKLGFELLDKLASEMEAVCVREGRPKREGRVLAMIVSPRPEVLKAVNENRRAIEKAKKKKKSEEKEQRAAAAAAASTTAGVGSFGVNGSLGAMSDDDSDDSGSDELLDIEADIESSLDDLFGSDDLTDDLFS